MIRWPWVLRSTLEAERQEWLDVTNQRTEERLTADRASGIEIAQLRTTIKEILATTERQDAIHERQMVASETRYADLMVSYRLLRLNGFSPPTAEPISIPIEKPDPVQAAINARAPDAKTRKMMEAQVRLDRSMDLTDPEIIARIERGNRPAEDFA